MPLHDASPLRGPAPALSARDLTKTYGSMPAVVHALDGIDLDLAGGELVALMGPSGSGKSTLMNVLSGLDDPTSGWVRLAGQVLGDLDDEAATVFRRRRMGFVFQSFNLLPTLTGQENIRLPHSFETDGRAYDVAWESELIALLALRDVVSRRPHELSGGEQQRVALARALVHHPAVVFADEPTGSLDAANGRAVLETLRGLVDRTGCAVVMATHDPTAAAWADRVVLMRDGRACRTVSGLTSADIAQATLQLAEGR